VPASPDEHVGFRESGEAGRAARLTVTTGGPDEWTGRIGPI
jgi:hypothetical protein